jgi:adenylate kinase family enzyme
MKIHILGAPGSGVSTLGKALAAQRQTPHFDTDDYHWFTDDALPYRRRRNPDHRRQLLGKDLTEHPSWVLSGALCGWGDVFIPHFEAVIWLWLPIETRLARIQERERLRYGASRIEAGGDLHGVYEKFLDWAAAYDLETDNIRSNAREQAWLETLCCPVLRMREEMPIEQVLEAVDIWMVKKQ